MRTVLEQLEARRAEAHLGGGQRRIRRPARQGQADGARAHRVLLDEGSFEEYDMYVTHRCTDSA